MHAHAAIPIMSESETTKRNPLSASPPFTTKTAIAKKDGKSRSTSCEPDKVAAAEKRSRRLSASSRISSAFSMARRSRSCEQNKSKTSDANRKSSDTKNKSSGGDSKDKCSDNAAAACKRGSAARKEIPDASKPKISEIKSKSSDSGIKPSAGKASRVSEEKSKAGAILRDEPRSPPSSLVKDAEDGHNSFYCWEACGEVLASQSAAVDTGGGLCTPYLPAAWLRKKR